jgi:excisionase family DNA binding protein
MRSPTVSSEPNRAERRGAARNKERPPVERAAYQINEFLAAYPISRSHLYNLIKDGKIRSVCLGGRRLIPVEEGQRLLSEGGC